MKTKNISEIWYLVQDKYRILFMLFCFFGTLFCDHPVFPKSYTMILIIGQIFDDSKTKVDYLFFFSGKYFFCAPPFLWDRIYFDTWFVLKASQIDLNHRCYFSIRPSQNIVRWSSVIQYDYVFRFVDRFSKGLVIE